MAADLVICFPHFSRIGTLIASPTGKARHGATNALGGGRSVFFHAASAATVSRFDFDLGSGVLKKPDFAILAGIRPLVLKDSAAVDFRVIGSASSSFTSPELEEFTISAADLEGPESQDYYAELNFASTFRYWRIEIETTASFAHVIGKILFGNWFDPIRPPLAPLNATARLDGPNVRTGSQDLEISFYDLSNAKVVEFNALAAASADSDMVFLRSRSYVHLLSGENMRAVELVQYQHRSVAVDRNVIAARFEELK